MPLAPGRLSTRADCAPASVSFCQTARARISVVPPGENGTTIRIGLLGYCAAAGNEASAADSTRKQQRRLIILAALLKVRTLPAISRTCLTSALGLRSAKR